MKRSEREMRLAERLEAVREAVLDQAEKEALSYIEVKDWNGLALWALKSGVNPRDVSK